MAGNHFSASFGDVTLSVAPQEMYATATTIEGRIRQSRSRFDAMIDKIHATADYWQGDAADAERKRFDNQKEDFRKLIVNLNNYVSELRAITAIYETGESQTTEASNSLQAGILS